MNIGTKFAKILHFIPIIYADTQKMLEKAAPFFYNLNKCDFSEVGIKNA